MIWGFFPSVVRPNVFAVSVRVNAEKYIALLDLCLLPYIKSYHGKETLLQQDNTPVQTAHLTKQFLFDSDVDGMDWLAWSTDLNPIKNVWAMLVRAVLLPSQLYFDTLM